MVLIISGSTNKQPKKYFEDVPDKELEKAQIDGNMLDYRRYKSFLNNKSNEIVEKLIKNRF